MKKLILALGFATLAGAAMADGYTAPIMEPEIVVADTVASGKDGIVVLLLLTAVAVAALTN